MWLKGLHSICNMGNCGLPDMYTLSPRPCRPWASGCTYQAAHPCPCYKYVLNVLLLLYTHCKSSYFLLYVRVKLTCIIYCSLGKIRREKIFVRCHVQRKLNTQKFSYYKEIEQFILVCSLLRRKIFTMEFFLMNIFNH